MNDITSGPAPNPHRWKILRIQVLMGFMASLDGSIVNIALPTMTDSLNVSVSAITWVVTSYLIAICALMLFFGRLGDIKGNTLIFRFGVVVFTAGSLLCGISMNLTMLIVSRMVQAIGAAASMATNQGIVTMVFPPNERGRALGFNATFVALGALLGPPLGGFIVSLLSWHFIFLINIPVGIIAFTLGRRVLPKSTSTNESLDIKGTVLFMLSMILIFYAIGVMEPMQPVNLFVLLSLIVGVLLLTAFILVERRQEQPMLDLSIFRNSLFTISVVCAFIVYMSVYSINLLQPFYLQEARSMSSFSSGLMMMIYPVVLAVTAPMAGYLSDKIGQKIPTLIGLCISTFGFAGAALMTLNTSMVMTGLVYCILGLGSALFQSPNTSLIMSSVPKNKVGVAGSINAFTRNMGFIFGTLLATTILFYSMSARYGQPVNDYVQGRPDLFVYGMSATYFVISGICFVGALITAFRLFRRASPARDK